MSRSCHIAIGITKDGEREIIGFMIQNKESDETWSAFEYLKFRGLQGTTCYFRRSQRFSKGD